MLVQKAFRYELMPVGEDCRRFSRFAGTKRYVWNAALKQPKYLGYAHNCGLLPELKKEHPWMKDIHSQVLQQSLKDLDTAFKNFFEGRAAHPKEKKKFKCQDSFRFPQHFKIEEGNSRICLPKIGWVLYRKSGRLRGVAKNITISRHGDKWFASIQTEFEVAEPVHKSTSKVGVDLGIVVFAADSNGKAIEPLNAAKKHAARLRRYQRAMARKVKFSKNWKKAKNKVAKTHLHIANFRKDFLHKLTTEQAKTHSLISIEDLKVSNMSRSAAGTVEEPGVTVRQKAGLNRAILDQGWSEYRRQLEYKMAWAGGRFVAVPAMNTSRTCSGCGHVSKENRKTQSSFLCVNCGLAANADLNAAINILGRGLKMIEGQDTTDASVGCASTARIACGGAADIKPPMKQEPTERAA
jgi:putative transposase